MWQVRQMPGFVVNVALFFFFFGINLTRRVADRGDILPFAAIGHPSVPTGRAAAGAINAAAVRVLGIVIEGMRPN